MIKILLLKEYQLVLIARLEELQTELGEPDCKLDQPFEIVDAGNDNYTMRPWPNFTTQKQLIIHSDSILTIVEPDKDQLDKYQALTANAAA
tara:strand:- start:1028 stop:1300 length:273 start_codon:yes stop_codon:yes gene_type:complete